MKTTTLMYFSISEAKKGEGGSGSGRRGGHGGLCFTWYLESAECLGVETCVGGGCLNLPDTLLCAIVDLSVDGTLKGVRS